MKENNIESRKIVAIYARVSTGRQEKEETIDSQIQACKEFANKKSFIVYYIYKDDGYSGSLLNRPALDKMRNDAANGKFQAVIIYDLDRLAREMYIQLHISRELEKNCIGIIDIKQPETDNKDDQQLLSRLKVEIAEYERTKILDRTRRGKLAKVKNNIIITSIPPFGFDYEKKTEHEGQKLVVNKPEFKAVMMIFNWVYHEKIGCRTICRRLEAKHIKTKKGNSTWSKSTVARILRNEIYAGVWYYGKNYRVEPNTSDQKKKIYRRVTKSILRRNTIDKWQPIRIELPKEYMVERKKYDAVQAILYDKAKHSRKPPKFQYLLSGLIFCGECGNRYFSTPYRDKPYYRCHGKKTLGKEKCKSCAVRANKLEGAVMLAISDLIGNNNPYVLDYIKTLGKNQTELLKPIQDRLYELNGRLTELEKKETRLMDLFTDGNYTKSKLDSLLIDVKNDRTRVLMEIEEVNQDLSVKKSIPDGFKISGTIVKKCLEIIKKRLGSISFDDRKHIVNMIVEKIVYRDGEMVITGNIPLIKPPVCLLTTTS